MSPDSSKPVNVLPNGVSPRRKNLRYLTGLILAYSAIVVVAFVVANFLVLFLIGLFQGFFGSVTNYINVNLAGVLIDVIAYGSMFAVVVLAARHLMREPLTKKLLGFTRGYRWKDLIFAIAGVVGYFVLAGIVTAIVVHFVPGFNAEEQQNIGFSGELGGVTKWLVFVLLVIVDPIFEETIFRGFLYGKMRQKGVPVWVAVLVTSVLFGAAHLQWNVGISVGALSVMLCLAREYSGSLNASITMHGFKNAIAFYYLFLYL
jgi:membrane protease YdiL (CAAX protease family)